MSASVMTDKSQVGEILPELVALAKKHCPEDGIHSSSIAPLYLIRASQVNEPMPLLYEPALCIIVQGSKHTMLGDEVYRYDPSHYLVVSVDLPMTGQVVEATPDKPYLCIRLDLDLMQIGELIRETMTESVPAQPKRGLYIGRSDVNLLNPVLRLLRLLDTPRDIPVLTPLIMREVLYRLLLSEEGARLQQIVISDSQTQRISQVINALKQNYSKPIRMEDLAREAHMSVSGLHHNFKKITAMSPLQYQKRLRLLEARRLLSSKVSDVTTACHKVGYESLSQFSREYSRLFGLPPSKDIQRLRVPANV